MGSCRRHLAYFGIQQVSTHKGMPKCFAQALQVFQDIGRLYMMRPVPHAKAPLFQAYARLALHTPAWPLRNLDVLQKSAYNENAAFCLLLLGLSSCARIHHAKPAF